MKESARYILQILVFLALILSIGTGGYLLIEDGIQPGDAFYMAVTAITPTQFDEVHKLSITGRYFTVVLVFCGFGAVVAFATQFARLVIQSELEGVGIFTRKQMRRRIGRMKNHYIVCGFGEIGGAICGELKNQQLPFVVIANDEASSAAIDREGYAVVKGNPTADASLKEAEIEHALGVIAVLPDDADNLFISLAARELNPKTFIIARGEDSGIEDRILRAGADIVVSPMKLGGRQIAGLIRQQSNASAPILGTEVQSAVMGLALKVYRHSVNHPLTIAEVLDKVRGVGAAGIHRCDGSFEASPALDSKVVTEDAVVVITKVEESGRSIHKPPTGKTILLADDHRALRLLFARKLASAGHEVIQAATGEEALATAKAMCPDLIVLDVNMPNRNGYEVCQAIREDRRLDGVPIILYSGDETDEFINLGKDVGANLCLRKSSKSSELLARIEELFVVNKQPEETSVSAVDDGRRLAGGKNKLTPEEIAFDISFALTNVDDDRKLLAELVGVMLEDTPQIMERLGVAVAQLDYPAIRLESHTLKSSVAILGAIQAETAAAKLEAIDNELDKNFVEQLHADLRNRIDELMTGLAQNFGQDSAPQSSDFEPKL